MGIHLEAFKATENVMMLWDDLLKLRGVLRCNIKLFASDLRIQGHGGPNSE